MIGIVFVFVLGLDLNIIIRKLVSVLLLVDAHGTFFMEFRLFIFIYLVNYPSCVLDWSRENQQACRTIRGCSSSPAITEWAIKVVTVVPVLARSIPVWSLSVLRRRPTPLNPWWAIVFLSFILLTSTLCKKRREKNRSRDIQSFPIE